MSELSYLFDHLSIEEIILFLLACLLAVKVIWSTLEWIWEKIKTKFDIANKKEKWENSLSEQIKNLANKIDKLEEQIQKTHTKQEKMDDSLLVVQERLQENTRSYLIDAHHKFCYQLKGIDDINLQSIERRYMYYKTAGGNSYIDGLIEDIRELPRINAYAQTTEDDNGKE